MNQVRDIHGYVKGQMVVWDRCEVEIQPQQELMRVIIRDSRTSPRSTRSIGDEKPSASEKANEEVICHRTRVVSWKGKDTSRKMLPRGPKLPAKSRDLDEYTLRQRDRSMRIEKVKYLVNKRLDSADLVVGG
jgi:hypothetical protein